MSKLVSIHRNPFARSETVRERISFAAECAWCGQPAKFRYGTHADGIATRPNMQQRVFCSRSCERSYNG